MSIALPAAQVGNRAGQLALSLLKKFTFPSSPAATQVTKKAVIPTAVGNVVKGVSKNVAIGSGTVLGTTALLSLTPGGQNVVSSTGESVKDITNLGENVTKLLTNNPLIPIGLLLLGGLILVSVLKK